MEVLTTPDEACQIRSKLHRDDGQAVDWVQFDGLQDYAPTLLAMERQAALVAAGEAPEAVWMLEHPPLYTGGTSAQPEDLINARFPVFPAGRGGQYTYHGPGQRVAYVMLDLTKRGRDVRCLVKGLEQWVIDTLEAYNIKGERRDGRVGVWVQRPDKGPGREDKIAAIGVRVRKWVTFHGISLNVAPDLGHYDGIVPCGIIDQGVTSFEGLGQIVSMEEVDSVMRARFETIFGETRRVSSALASSA